MFISRRHLHPPTNILNMGIYNFSKVQQFKYLGTMVIEHNDIAREVTAKI